MLDGSLLEYTDGQLAPSLPRPNAALFIPYHASAVATLNSQAGFPIARGMTEPLLEDNY